MILSKVTGGFPIAIGTSLALESCFKPTHPPYDPNRKIPKWINLDHYDRVAINLATLIRNIKGAYPKEDPRVNKTTFIVDELMTELDIINTIFINNNRLKPYYYYSEYALDKPYSLRENGKSVHDRGFYHLVVNLIKRDLYFRFKSNMVQIKDPSIILISHYPYDLTQYQYYRRLDLLESHTGVLKSRTQWSDKYNEVGNLPLNHLPFNGLLLAHLGDRHLIRPGPILFRKAIIEKSLTLKWTPLTGIREVARVIDSLTKESP